MYLLYDKRFNETASSTLSLQILRQNGAPLLQDKTMYIKDILLLRMQFSTVRSAVLLETSTLI